MLLTLSFPDLSDPDATKAIQSTQKTYPVHLPYLEKAGAGGAHSSVADEYLSITSWLKVNLKEVEIPVLLKGLHTYMEKI